MIWIYITCFIIGVIVGVIFEYCFEYWRNLKEFNKRQERYRRLIWMSDYDDLTLEELVKLAAKKMREDDDWKTIQIQW